MLMKQDEMACPWPMCKNKIKWIYKKDGVTIRLCPEHWKVLIKEFRNGLSVIKTIMRSAHRVSYDVFFYTIYPKAKGGPVYTERLRRRTKELEN